MSFYECSAKTGLGVDSIFVDSATAIAQKIEAGHYDLLSEVFTYIK